jgi:hypothetical protein
MSLSKWTCANRPWAQACPKGWQITCMWTLGLLKLGERVTPFPYYWSYSCICQCIITFYRECGLDVLLVGCVHDIQFKNISLGHSWSFFNLDCHANLSWCFANKWKKHVDGRDLIWLTFDIIWVHWFKSMKLFCGVLSTWTRRHALHYNRLDWWLQDVKICKMCAFCNTNRYAFKILK